MTTNAWLGIGLGGVGLYLLYKYYGEQLVPAGTTPVTTNANTQTGVSTSAGGTTPTPATQPTTTVVDQGAATGTGTGEGQGTPVTTTQAQQLTNFDKVAAEMKNSGQDPSGSYGPDTFNYYWNQLFPDRVAPAPENMGIPRGVNYNFSQWQAAMLSRGFSGLGNIVPSVAFGVRNRGNLAPTGIERMFKRSY